MTEEGASPSAWAVRRGCPQEKRSRVIALTLTRHPKTLLPQANLPAPPGHTQTWYEEARGSPAPAGPDLEGGFPHTQEKGTAPHSVHARQEELESFGWQ